MKKTLYTDIPQQNLKEVQKYLGLMHDLHKQRNFQSENGFEHYKKGFYVDCGQQP